MGIDVTVAVDCSGCNRTIDEDDEVYCEACALAVADCVDGGTGQCMKCKLWHVREKMISKIAGLMCLKCAKAYETELLEQKVSA